MRKSRKYLIPTLSLFSLTYIASDGDNPDTRTLIKGSALAILDLDGLD